MQGQEWDLMILVDPFQLRTFYVSMILQCLDGTFLGPYLDMIKGNRQYCTSMVLLVSARLQMISLLLFIGTMFNASLIHRHCLHIGLV